MEQRVHLKSHCPLNILHKGIFSHIKASRLHGYPDTALFWDLSIMKDFSYNML